MSMTDHSNAAPQSITIRPVRTRRDQADFYQIKRQIYRNEPAAVIPLRSMEWLQLDTQRHPFYEHARREVWVAYRHGKPIARIAAIIDDLFNEHYQDRMGFVGFFECPDDETVSHVLFETAFQWLKVQGCRTVRGPVNPSMKGEFGVLLEGHEYPPYVMMGYTPRYYDRLFQAAGFQPAKRFFCYLLNNEVDLPGLREKYVKLNASCERIRQRYPELEVRCATKETIGPMLREINRIGNTVRSQGWGFVPMTDAELNFMVKQLIRIVDPERVIGCYLGEQLLGYNVTIPNVNWAIKRAKGPWDWLRYLQLAFWLKRIPEVRLLAIGVDPEIRNKGVAPLVTNAMVELAEKSTRWEFGWIAEDNHLSIAMLTRAIPIRQYKTYQVYQRDVR